MKDNYERLIDTARGIEEADVVIKNAQIINVFTSEIEQGDIAICGGKIAGIGSYEKAKEVIDANGDFFAPALINGHVHIESSMLNIKQYARAVVARGVLGIVTDLHEITNVCGVKAIEFIAKEAKNLPLQVNIMMPSCVPATHLETSGANVSAEDIKEAIGKGLVMGLGEMMNFPGVLFKDAEVKAKIENAKGMPIDGHAPSLSGKDLNAYISAGVMSDHESVKLDEAEEKLKRGMYIMIREGSSEKNLEELLPLVKRYNSNRCMFVTDDRNCSDIYKDGDMDAVIRKAVKLGISPIASIKMATINPAEYFGLEGYGAIAPGYYANLIRLSDLESFTIKEVYHNGKMAARDGKALFEVNDKQASKDMRNSIFVKPFSEWDIQVKPKSKDMPVIELVRGQIVTKKVYESAKIEDGYAVADISRDIIKLAVFERHISSGQIGICFVKGFGINKGAIASSVAHDSHNIIAAGANDADIMLCVEKIKEMGGGLAVTKGGEVLSSLALPICGLMSDKPLEKLVKLFDEVQESAKTLGNLPDEPFAMLSFLALPVIPEIKLTDKGLVDVNTFDFIDWLAQ